MKVIQLCSFSLLLTIFCVNVSNAQNNRGITTIYLTRHVEKNNDGTKDPGLTTLGTKRAENLSYLLKAIKFDTIYSTPYKRTNETVLALANQQGEKIVKYQPFDKNRFVGLTKNSPGGTYLIAGHSNTIPAIVNAIIDEERFSQLADDDYGKLFVISIVDGDLSNVQILNY